MKPFSRLNSRKRFYCFPDTEYNIMLIPVIGLPRKKGCLFGNGNRCPTGREIHLVARILYCNGVNYLEYSYDI